MRVDCKFIHYSTEEIIRTGGFLQLIGYLAVETGPKKPKSWLKKFRVYSQVLATENFKARALENMNNILISYSFHSCLTYVFYR